MTRLPPRRPDRVRPRIDWRFLLGIIAVLGAILLVALALSSSI